MNDLQNKAAMQNRIRQLFNWSFQVAAGLDNMPLQTAKIIESGLSYLKDRKQIEDFRVEYRVQEASYIVGAKIMLTGEDLSMAQIGFLEKEEACLIPIQGKFTLQ